MYGRALKSVLDKLIGPNGVLGPDLEARTHWVFGPGHVYRARGGKGPEATP